MVRLLGRAPIQFYFGLALGVVITAFGWVGQSDYAQEVADNQFYCDMVAQHVWPKRSDRECPKPPLVPGERLVSL